MHTTVESPLMLHSEQMQQPQIHPIEDWDKKHAWHKFTQMEEYYASNPLTIERGIGCWLFDTDNRRYLDGIASMWTSVHGYNDAELNATLIEQLQKIAYTSFVGLNHPNASKLSHALTQAAPAPLTRVFFNNNGANAIETALKMSVQYWHNIGQPEKHHFISLARGYHGCTFGVMSVSDSPAFFAPFEKLCFPCEHFCSPAQSSLEASLADLERLLQKQQGSTAAVILEPSIQSAAGMVFQPAGFLKGVETLCHKYQAHLIFDEVFVGMGRTGPLFACQSENVCPDFLCLGKGLGAGYTPISATLLKEETFEAFLGAYDSGKTFFHGHTYSVNPIAAAVALKSLEKLQARIASGIHEENANYMAQAAQALLSEHPNVKAYRTRGFVAAIDLCKKDGTDFDPKLRTGHHVCLQARKNGLLIRPLGDTLFLIPPLIIDKRCIDFLMEKTALSITEYLTI